MNLTIKFSLSDNEASPGNDDSQQPEARGQSVLHKDMELMKLQLVQEMKKTVKEEISAIGGTLSHQMQSTGGALSHQIQSTGGALSHQIQSTGGALSQQLQSTGGALSHQIQSTGGALSHKIQSTGGTLSHQMHSTGETLSQQIHATGSGLARTVMTDASDASNVPVECKLPVLKRNQEAIVEYLEPTDDTLKKLFAHGVITRNEWGKIEGQKSEKGRTKLLLLIVDEKRSNDIVGFMADALEETQPGNNKLLADVLEKDLNSE